MTAVPICELVLKLYNDDRRRRQKYKRDEWTKPCVPQFTQLGGGNGGMVRRVPRMGGGRAHVRAHARARDMVVERREG